MKIQLLRSSTMRIWPRWWIKFRNSIQMKLKISSAFKRSLMLSSRQQEHSLRTSWSFSLEAGLFHFTFRSSNSNRISLMIKIQSQSLFATLYVWQSAFISSSLNWCSWWRWAKRNTLNTGITLLILGSSGFRSFISFWGCEIKTLIFLFIHLIKMRKFILHGSYLRLGL